MFYVALIVWFILAIIYGCVRIWIVLAKYKIRHGTDKVDNFKMNGG